MYCHIHDCGNIPTHCFKHKKSRKVQGRYCYKHAIQMRDDEGQPFRNCFLVDLNE